MLGAERRRPGHRLIDRLVNRHAIHSYNFGPQFDACFISRAARCDKIDDRAAIIHIADRQPHTTGGGKLEVFDAALVRSHAHLESTRKTHAAQSGRRRRVVVLLRFDKAWAELLDLASQSISLYSVKAYSLRIFSIIASNASL